MLTGCDRCRLPEFKARKQDELGRIVIFGRNGGGASGSGGGSGHGGGGGGGGSGRPSGSQ